MHLLTKMVDVQFEDQGPYISPSAVCPWTQTAVAPNKQALLAFTNSATFQWELVRHHLEPSKYITVVTVA